jgi:hypothetical protein
VTVSKRPEVKVPRAFADYKVAIDREAIAATGVRLIEI